MAKTELPLPINVYQISAPHFCAGIVVGNGTIYQAAPILKWTIGKQFIWFEYYCGSKNWKIVEVKEK